MLKSKRKNTITSFFDGSNSETLKVLSPCFEDDFFGSLVNEYRWTKYTLGADPPTQVIVSVENGACALTLTNAIEAQISGLYFGDICPFRLDRGPIIEARVMWTVMPTENTKMTAVLGLCNATAGDIDAITDSVWFRWDGDTGGLITLESDDTAHEQSKVTSGVTSLINTWQILRLDLTDMQNVRFYIDGARVAKATSFIIHTDVDQEYQPMIRLDKAADALDLGVLKVDYVRVWQTRD